jgi:hypothetical protein
MINISKIQIQIMTLDHLEQYCYAPCKKIIVNLLLLVTCVKSVKKLPFILYPLFRRKTPTEPSPSLTYKQTYKYAVMQYNKRILYFRNMTFSVAWLIFFTLMYQGSLNLLKDTVMLQNSLFCCDVCVNK